MDPVSLTPRQTEVLRLLARGYQCGEIASVLFLEPKTVRRHLEGIHERLDTRTVGHAVHVAHVRGILTVDQVVVAEAVAVA